MPTTMSTTEQQTEEATMTEVLAAATERELQPPILRTTAAPQQVSGYEHLERILKLAYDQSASGKGKARHAAGPTGFRPWDRQPILEISRMVGPGYASGQVAKKVQEAVTMAGNGNLDGARAEALGAIVYAAALFKLFEEM